MQVQLATDQWCRRRIRLDGQSEDSTIKAGKQGGKPSLRSFHDTLLGHGSAPFWALRKLMLDGHNDVVLE